MQFLERDFELDEILKKPLMASLSTAIGSLGSGFVRRLQADNRASIGIVDFNLSAGTLRHLGMRGTVEVLPAQADRLERLLERYLGPASQWNPWFTSEVIEKQDTLLMFTPGTVVARDQSYFK